MQLVDALYIVSSVIIIVTILSIVRLALQSYVQTDSVSMIHLAIGFVLISAATIATLISAFLTGFSFVRSLLAVNTGMTACGYLFVLYSLFTFE